MIFAKSSKLFADGMWNFHGMVVTSTRIERKMQITLFIKETETMSQTSKSSVI